MSTLGHLRSFVANDDGVRDPRDHSDGHPDRYSIVDNAVSEVLLVLRIAQEVEPNPNAILAWYQDTKIREMDSLTAKELVNQGRATEVVRFLRTLHSGTPHYPLIHT